MKMNKKGFTLIEMLAVIAIIAVLVAIIVPAVGSSTTKAKAATDAANLRSVAASVAVDYLNKGEYVADGTTLENPANAPTCKTYSDAKLNITVSNGQIIAKFCTHDVDHFAKIADGTNQPVK